MRKKFCITLLLFVAGTGLAFYTGATLLAYTAFATLLLGTFGTQDLIGKKFEIK